MLQHLHIQNYALIEELDIDFEQGFSVITGETGAGKSILLGALGLLLGQRADSKSIKDGANKCTIEATFNLAGYDMKDLFEENDLDYEEECVIRREITSAGKSRAFVNDTPCNVSQLKEIGEQLIDIHSQHQNLLLSHENFQLQVLDILAGDKDELNQYQNTFQTFKRLRRELQEAKDAAAKDKEQLDYISYQVEQLQDAHLVAGEEEKLEKELKILENAEDIKSSLYQISCLMDDDDAGLVNMLREAYKQLEKVSRIYENAEELASRTESCYIEIKDIASEIADKVDSIEYDPERMQWVNDRLSLLYDLENKHHVDDSTELLEVQQRLEKQLDEITNSDDNIQKLEKQLHDIEARLIKEAQVLSKLRQKAAKSAEDEMVKRLSPLGMPNVQFKIEIAESNDFELTGKDRVTFMFNANKNATLQPISNIASGGEIARVMLSLKALICGAVKLPTIIFDEIDTGVSGQIAEKMALIMKEMGADHNLQVISITHLPQIAALGGNHYKVYKEDNDTTTTSHIVRLTNEERINEIAHMLSGSEITDAAIKNAKSLLHI